MALDIDTFAVEDYIALILLASPAVTALRTACAQICRSAALAQNLILQAEKTQLRVSKTKRHYTKDLSVFSVAFSAQWGARTPDISVFSPIVDPGAVLSFIRIPVCGEIAGQVCERMDSEEFYGCGRWMAGGRAGGGELTISYAAYPCSQGWVLAGIRRFRTAISSCYRHGMTPFDVKYQSRQLACYRYSSTDRINQLGLELLSNQLPCFRSRETCVRILSGPQDFYASLLDMISKARRRIFIASLYIGKQETELVAAMITALERHQDLELYLVVDYLRSTREHPNPSSAALLARLKNRFPLRVKVFLFHTPELFGLKKALIPRRFDEGWGLQHMKIYGADDNVIMSGANLSRDYFTNRQDRYVAFSNQAALADYLAELCQITGSLSYQLGQSSLNDLNILWSNEILQCQPTQSKSASNDFKLAGKEIFRSFTTRWHQKSLGERQRYNMSSERQGLLIFPVLQMGPFGISQETSLLVPKIIELASERPIGLDGWQTQLHWTSGYFSLLREYKRQLLLSKADVRIITASPQANGFFQSKGISKYIPPAYTYLEKLFYKEITLAKKQDQIQIREWRRDGWTYHAKGLWLIRPNNGHQSCLLTTIGSSNYGRRSAERDLECNLLIINEDEKGNLSSKLVIELTRLQNWAKDFVDYNLFQREDRRVKTGVKVATTLIRNML
ncbi:hypothetical protein O181_025665 [Austropuccinia psidii MF-1]|uniref:CDP-diacylglycerol--glycerol-3-phosphate 3-phosphatidyltransferase n=1 Tax=Austropuccinia psidii MF-1 TaxID=1389203 RepID=A0A9Q3H1E1_9BASI|nr:hypothetical protein [Austropuccinia psidii MF-1]